MPISITGCKNRTVFASTGNFLSSLLIHILLALFMKLWKAVIYHKIGFFGIFFGRLMKIMEIEFFYPKPLDEKNNKLCGKSFIRSKCFPRVHSAFECWTWSGDNFHQLLLHGQTISAIMDTKFIIYAIILVNFSLRQRSCQRFGDRRFFWSLFCDRN